MYIKNCWYCAGWDSDFHLGRDALVHRQIAGEDLVLYRKVGGGIVAMEDRCPHRHAPLSLGQRDGEGIRCMYHGMKFESDGVCSHVPGQRAPSKACVRVLPVVERNNWVWVWLGDPSKADPALICDSVGPGHPDYHILVSKIRVQTNYRLELANLMDLSHLTWVHRESFGGTDAYTEAKPRDVPLPSGRGLVGEFWLRSVRAPKFAQHMFPLDQLFDMHFVRTMTVPCNFILHFSIHAAGTATEGPSDGALILDTYTSQAITPRDEDEVDYYFSWGTTHATDGPGVTNMLYDAVHMAFLEDKQMLEAQHLRVKAKPHAATVDIVHDNGPIRMLRILDKLIEGELKQEQPGLQLVAG